MIARLNIPGGWMWSAWQADRGLPFNSYLFERDGGCVAVDPLPLDATSTEQIAKLGGVHTIVLTNRDHERGTQALREAFGARVLAHSAEAKLFTVPVDATFADDDEVFDGARVIALGHGKTPGEVALHLVESRAAIVGDALIGAPAGALSLLPDEKLENRGAFVLALRRLWAQQLETLLLCDGQPIFGGADAAIASLLRRTGGPMISRMNADEIPYRVLASRPEKYRCEDGEIGLFLGARRLGYRLVRIPPGRIFCPLHWHVRSEEFFYVVEGCPKIRALDGTIECRPGDFIAFPVGETGSHQVFNDNAESALVLLVGIEESELQFEACFYPDSDKVGLFTPERSLGILRASPSLNYYDGEL